MSVLLQNVTVSYQRRPAVHHVSGRICAGVATAIVGPNGAGTLLKAIAGVLTMDSGQVLFSDCTQTELAYLPQKAEIDLSMPMTVFELVATGLWRTVGAFGRVSADGVARIERALVQVGMFDFSARPLQALSIGQLQRVLFARILVQDAPVILLDEPFNAVDANTTEVLLGLVRQWQLEQRTISLRCCMTLSRSNIIFKKRYCSRTKSVAWGKPADVLTVANLMVRTSVARIGMTAPKSTYTEVLDMGQKQIDPIAHSCGHTHSNAPNHNEEGA